MWEGGGWLDWWICVCEREREREGGRGVCVVMGISQGVERGDIVEALIVWILFGVWLVLYFSEMFLLLGFVG